MTTMFTPEKKELKKKSLVRKRNHSTVAVDLFSPTSNKPTTSKKSKKQAKVQERTPFIEKNSQANNLFDDISTERCISSPIKKINFDCSSVFGTMEIVMSGGSRRGVNIMSETWTMQVVIESFMHNIDTSTISIKNDIDEAVDMNQIASKLDLNRTYYVQVKV